MKISIIKTNEYRMISDSHILIINGKTDVKMNPFCKGLLKFDIDDIETIDVDKRFFTLDDASSILDIIETQIGSVNHIVCMDKDGHIASAIASAIKLILTNINDDIYAYTIPNKLVYLTMLQCFYESMNKWPNINKLHRKSVYSFLSLLQKRDYEERYGRN